MKSKDVLGNLIEQLGKLPGLGEKSAERIAIYLLKSPNAYVKNLCESIQSLKNIKHCKACYNLTVKKDYCRICEGPYRDKSVICVVEEVSDLWVLEQTGAYKGLYHILGGRIAPLDNIGPEKLTIGHLLKRAKTNGVKEIILATNYTLEGEATASYISDRLKNTGVKISRIARGIPTGSRIETATRPMLADALRDRKSFNPNFLDK